MPEHENMTVEQLFHALKAEIQSSENRILQKLEKQNSKVVKLQRENRQLKLKIEQLERRSKKNNLIIFGLQVAENIPKEELCEKTLATLNKNLDLDLKQEQLADIYSFGSPGKKQVIIELASCFTKRAVLKNVNKLKGTGIVVTHDKTKQEQIRNKILLQHIKKAREEGKKAVIKKGRLVIDGEELDIDDLDIPEGLEVYQSSSEESIEEEVEDSGDQEEATGTKRKTISPLEHRSKKRSTNSPKYYRTRAKGKIN